MGFEKAVGFSVGKVFVEGWEPWRWVGGTAGVLLCPVSLGAGAKRGRFVPTAPVSAVGRCPPGLDPVAPHNVNPSCEEPFAHAEQGHLVGAMC